VTVIGTSIALHPDNPRYFTFRGKPWFLLCATEHYGSVLNRNFDYIRYLDEAAERHQTFTRTFLLFRELQAALNPYSPCKVESPDFVTPWPRVGPGAAPDGELRYDLDRWNEEYFDRLHGFVRAAGERDVIVEATLFSNSYHDGIWQLNPLHHAANINGLPEINYADYNSLRHPEIVERQVAYADKVVRELNVYDNIFFEVCNEPGGGLPDHATPAEVDQWQASIATRIRQIEATLPNKHLVVGSQSFCYSPWEQFCDEAFASDVFDAVNVHPLVNTGFRDKPTDFGQFMSKQLHLDNVSSFCADAAKYSKPCNLDEDNAATMHRDFDGWTIHRKRAWVAILSGLHYDMIDFTINCGVEASTPTARANLRSWMQHLTDFWQSVDFVRASRVDEIVGAQPAHTTAVAVEIPGSGHYVYLADNRELGDDVGAPVTGPLSLPLLVGDYDVRCFAPTTGGWSPSVRATAAEDGLTVNVPEFVHDVVIHLRPV
jgi:hypothetical protein